MENQTPQSTQNPIPTQTAEQPVQPQTQVPQMQVKPKKSKKRLLLSLLLAVLVIFLIIGGYLLYNKFLNKTAPQTETSTSNIKPTSNPNPTVEVKNTCLISGCNNEICYDSSDGPMVIGQCSTNASDACYKTAKCEKQSNGKCGWTQTEELKTCIQTTK